MLIKNRENLYVSFGSIAFRLVSFTKFVPANSLEFNSEANEDYTEYLSEWDMQQEISERVEQYSNLKEKAEKLAREAHAGQKDKSGRDYFTAHIETVANMLSKEGDINTDLIIIALLHDIIEDTNVTEEELRKEFPEHIVDAVVVLTKKDDEDYLDYVRNIKKNPLARKVKLCDLANNMDLSRLNVVTEKDEKRILKYASAYAELMK